MRSKTLVSPNLVLIWLEVKVENRWEHQWIPHECKNQSFAGLLEAAGMAGSVAEGQRLIRQNAVKTRESYNLPFTKIKPSEFRSMAPDCEIIMMMVGKGNWRLDVNPDKPGAHIQRPGYREFYIPCHFIIKDEPGCEDDEWDSTPE